MMVYQVYKNENQVYKNENQGLEPFGAVLYLTFGL